MTVIHMRPFGWGEITPRQWSAMRELIALVSETANRRANAGLLIRAQLFLLSTEGYDV